MTVSTPVKIVALAGLAIALGLGGLLLLTNKNGAAVTPPAAAAPPVTHSPAPVRHVAAAPKAKPKPVHHKPALKLMPNLPAAVRHALMTRPVAVVTVYSSQSALDRSILAEARAGARTAHAAFVAANVALEPMAAAVATWSTTVADPAVIVVRRPGNVVFTVTGPTDRDTVAQAAAQAAK